MGARSGDVPSVEQSFMWRLLHALDMKPVDLARELRLQGLQVRTPDLIALLNETPTTFNDFDRDAIWQTIETIVNRQLGYLMAAQSELNRVLQQQRTSRVLRAQRQETRQSVLSPYSLNRRRGGQRY